jgi:hypothetical protein
MLCFETFALGSECGALGVWGWYALKQQNIKFVTFIALSIILVKDSKRGKKCSKKILNLYILYLL